MNICRHGVKAKRSPYIDLIRQESNLNKGYWVKGKSRLKRNSFFKEKISFHYVEEI